MSDNLQLSAATLAALKDFAKEKGIAIEEENDDNDESENIVQQVRIHFQVKDREEIFKFKFGSIEFALNGVKRELGQTLTSTGLTLWRAAEHLSNFCYDHPELFREKSIIELGAGIGVVSILLDKMDVASSIIVTDGDDDTLTLLQENIKQVQSAIIPQKLYWGEHDAFIAQYPDKFDVIIAADVIYEDEQVQPLLETATILMNTTSKFYLAYARRNIPIDTVLHVAQEKGLGWEVIDAGDGKEPVYCFSLVHQDEGSLH